MQARPEATRYDRDQLAGVLGEARALVARPDNDFAWSSWLDAADALAELDAGIAAARAGTADLFTLGVLFAPTGPMQELALSSGWGDEFLSVAGRFDSVIGEPAARGHVLCSRCPERAATVEIVGPEPRRELRRVSFTGTLTQPISPSTFERVRALLHPPDAAGLFALDPEFAPCWCPTCCAAFCGAHWDRVDMFDDDGFHDSIRGRCPEGHERMLED